MNISVLSVVMALAVGVASGQSSGNVKQTIVKIEEEMLQALLKGDPSATTDMKVNVYGDTAIATYTTTDKGAYEGRDISGKYRWTDVFVRLKGNWRLDGATRVIPTVVPEPANIALLATGLATWHCGNINPGNLLAGQRPIHNSAAPA